MIPGREQTPYLHTWGSWTSQNQGNISPSAEGDSYLSIKYFETENAHMKVKKAISSVLAIQIYVVKDWVILIIYRYSHVYIFPKKFLRY